MKKRIAALLMSFCMLISLCPASVFADTQTEPEIHVYEPQPIENGGNSSYTSSGAVMFKVAPKSTEMLKGTLLAQYVVVYNDGEMFFQATDEPVEGKTIKNIFGIDETDPDTGLPAWNIEKNEVTHVVFSNPTAPTTTAYWFDGFRMLQAIDGLEKLDTGSTTDMKNMFSDCEALTSLDVSRFDTSAVTDMSNMFSGCSDLTSLDVSGFVTNKVTDMRYMFFECGSLSTLIINGIDTSEVTDMQNMFKGCNLTVLDLSSFNTGKVQDTS